MMVPAARILAALTPGHLYACATCFGTSDNPGIGRAYSLGILILMGFTFLILGALVLAVYRIEVLRAAPQLLSEVDAVGTTNTRIGTEAVALEGGHAS